MAFKLAKDIPRGTTFAYRTPPRSGNEINGLGEGDYRRASHVFHNDGDDALPWNRLDHLFGYVMHWKVAYWIMRNMWNLRRATGPAAARRQEISDPDQMTSEIMARAKTLGADLVGVTDVKPHHVYEGHEVPYRFAISIGVEMDRGRMAGIPDNVAAGEVMRAYAQVGRVVGLLSEGDSPEGMAGARLRQPEQWRSPSDPCRDRLRLRPAREARIAHLEGARFELPPRLCGHGSPPRPDQSACRHRRRRPVRTMQHLRSQLSRRRDPRRAPARAWRAQVVHRLRQVHLLLLRDERLRHLHRGVPLE